MKNNKKKVFQKNSAGLFLGMLSVIAEKNAASLCKGFLYEPEIPKNLRKENEMCNY